MSGEIEFRSARLADVSFPKRTIELVVMPYETPAAVTFAGREIEEVVSRGAWDGIEHRISQGRPVRVNRDHDLGRSFGRATAFHPSREEGLVAELYIARSELGEESLILAEDGILDASAGFTLLRENGRVRPDAEVWESRSRRRLNHLFLHHIALTPEPAYETANVLAVRTAEQPATGEARPRLDELRLRELEALEADMNRRYARLSESR